MLRTPSYSMETSIEVRRRNKLLKKFGTADILEILGPAGTLPPTQSLSMKLKEFGIQPCNVSTWLRTYVPADLLEKLKPYQEQLRREGIQSTHSQRTSEEIAEAKQKRQATCLVKYGTLSATAAPSVKAKRHATNQLRYGGNSPQCDPAIVEKRRQTNQLRYGSTCSLNNPEVRRKAIETSTLKYGSADFKCLSPEQLLTRLAQQGLEALGPVTQYSDFYKYNPLKVRCLNCGRVYEAKLKRSGNLQIGDRLSCVGFDACECHKQHTKLEAVLSEYIQSLGHTCSSFRPDWLDHKEIDLFIPELNIGFEVNGYYTHNSVSAPFPGALPKPVDYHATKTSRCLAHGILLYHIWHNQNTPAEQEAAKSLIQAVLIGCIPDVDPGDTISRDILPDPSIIGLPCVDLGPQAFDSPYGTCYTSGLWQF